MNTQPQVRTIVPTALKLEASVGENLTNAQLEYYIGGIQNTIPQGAEFEFDQTVRNIAAMTTEQWLDIGSGTRSPESTTCKEPLILRKPGSEEESHAIFRHVRAIAARKFSEKVVGIVQEGVKVGPAYIPPPLHELAIEAEASAIAELSNLSDEGQEASFCLDYAVMQAVFGTMPRVGLSGRQLRSMEALGQVNIAASAVLDRKKGTGRSDCPDGHPGPTGPRSALGELWATLMGAAHACDTLNEVPSRSEKEEAQLKRIEALSWKYLELYGFAVLLAVRDALVLELGSRALKN